MKRAKYLSLRATAEVWLWRHGWIWSACALLAIACVGAFGLVLLPLQDRQQQLARETTELRHQQDRAQAGALVAAAADAASTEAGRQQALQALLSQTPGADAQMRVIARIAAQHNVALLQGDYQYSNLADADISGVQLSLPVKGSYPQLRLFVQEVLQALPNASLNHMSFRRDNVAQDQAEARLKWTLWSKAGSTKAGIPVDAPLQLQRGPAS